MSVIWIAILCSFSYAQSEVSLHTTRCSDTQEISTARLPQQCIKLNGVAKPLRYIFPISRKGHYIKVISNNNVLEFIIRKEDCPKELTKGLTSEEQKAFSNNKMVRLYQKNINCNTWSTIATIPEQQAHRTMSKMFVCPDGSIQL